MFQVTLTGVTEANQAIDPTSSVVNVTVLSNDNPEGMFSFTSTSIGPHVIEEISDANNTVTLTVYRSGGSLTQERLIFRTSPLGVCVCVRLCVVCVFVFVSVCVCMYVCLYVSTLLLAICVPPTARSDLLGSEGVVEFSPGDTLMNIILAPRNDDLPEVCAMGGEGEVGG